MSYKIKRIFNSYENQAWQKLLSRSDLKVERAIDFTIGIYDGDILIATGSLYQNIMKCVAIDANYHGGAVFNQLISALEDEIYQRKYLSIFVYTKYDLLSAFSALGFKEIASVSPFLVFMEKALVDFDAFLAELKTAYVSSSHKAIAGIVMNANPFTKGHQFLIETAAAENDVVHVFVLSEDVSEFPTTVRTALVVESVTHLPNVYVHETNEYLVSSKTFPAYFLPDDEATTRVQATLDVTIFLKIAAILGITTRYVGEEPYSVTTNIYNEVMAQMYRGKLKLLVIKRLALSDGEIISATKVRKALANDDLVHVKALVPQATYDFLQTDAGAVIISKIQKQKQLGGSEEK